MPSPLAGQLSIFATLILIPLTVAAGWLSDVFGRKKIVVLGIGLGALFIFPSFSLLQSLGNTFNQNQLQSTLLLIFFILISLTYILALVVGPQTALLAELFPAKNRNSAATLPHNLAAGWIGGLLPLIVTWLNNTGEAIRLGLYPTLFLTIAAILALKQLPETNI